MATRRALMVAALLVFCVSCSGSPAAPDAAETTDVGISDAYSAAADEPAPTEPVPSATTLAPGALVELVPSAGELPAGYTITADSAGPVDLAAVADRSADPEAAEQTLRSAGFKVGYAADYGNEQTGGFVSVLVIQFAGAEGAKSEYARQVAAAAEVAEREPLAKVGEESAAFREHVPEGDVAEIVSIHFRVGDLVWVVETGGQDASESSLALAIAMKLVKRTA